MTKYQVFGRKEYSEPLVLLAPLEAASDADLQARALEQYGQDWIELVAARDEDVVEVALKR